MVDKRLFDEYERGLTGNAEFVADAVRTLVGMLSGVAAGSLPEALLEGYRSLVGTYGTVAATIAVEFYRALRAQSGASTAYEPVIFPADDSNLLPHDVEQAVKSSGGDPSKLASALAAVSQQRVMEHADQTLGSNARRDPAHPKWALVPHANACSWCRLLGSQGFRYGSEAKALASRHPNCLCTPVVDFDARDPRLDGYDPDALFGEYADARAEVEAGAREQWGSMSAEERARYERKGRSAYDVFLRNKIVGAMGR